MYFWCGLSLLHIERWFYCCDRNTIFCMMRLKCQWFVGKPICTQARCCCQSSSKVFVCVCVMLWPLWCMFDASSTCTDWDDVWEGMHCNPVLLFRIYSTNDQILQIALKWPFRFFLLLLLLLFSAPIFYEDCKTAIHIWMGSPFFRFFFFRESYSMFACRACLSDVCSTCKVISNRSCTNRNAWYPRERRNLWRTQFMLL